MEMGDDDACDGLAAQGVLEHAVPGGAGFLGVDAGVDESPAVAVFQHPQVDMVQLERQGHAQPAHAGHDLPGFAKGRFTVEGIIGLERHGRMGSEWSSGRECDCYHASRRPGKPGRGGVREQIKDG
jgi:hypothetical protein